MEIKNQVKKLLSTEMDRQSFIRHVAVGALAMIGGGALLQLLAQGNHAGLRGASSDLTYSGDSVYGGGSQVGGGAPRRRVG